MKRSAEERLQSEKREKRQKELLNTKEKYKNKYKNKGKRNEVQ